MDQARMKAALLLSCFMILTQEFGSVSGQMTVNAVYTGSAFFEVFPGPDSPPQSSVQWFINTVTVIALVTPPGFPQYNPQYRGRCELYNNGTLRLDRLNYTDQREYDVIISNIDTDYNYHNSYMLHVYSMISVGPILTINSSTPGELIGGTYLSLHCDAGSHNVSTYTFYRDGKNACSDPLVSCNNGLLTFQPITGSHSGNYICTIQNPFSSKTSDPLKLLVIVPVSGLILTSNASELVWPGMDSVALHCSANGTNNKYTWNLNGAPLPSSPRYHLSQNNSVLTISPVSAGDDGIFTCTAQNAINYETSNGVKITMASPVSRVSLALNSSQILWVSQDSISLNCSSLGTAVHFSWELEGQALPENPRYHTASGVSPPHSTLTISPVSKDDTGNFNCVASNKINSGTSNKIALQLAWSPEEHMLCLTRSTSLNVLLACSWPGGQPPANVTMVFNGVTKTEQNEVTISVPLSSIHEGSTMECDGTHLGKPSRCSLFFEPPQSSGHDSTGVTYVASGQAAVMTLNLETGLDAEFTWYRLSQSFKLILDDERFIIMSSNLKSSLLITGVTPEDAGSYECRARNIAGSRNFLFTLNVKETQPTICPSCNGLGGGEVAGIVIGSIAGIFLLEVIVFFLLRSKKKTPKGTIYENVSDPQPHTNTTAMRNVYENGSIFQSHYATTMPGAESTTAKPTQESNYEQLVHPDRATYNTLEPGSMK